MRTGALDSSSLGKRKSERKGRNGRQGFATAPVAVAPGVKEPGPRVAICYNPFKTEPEKVQTLAQAECFGNASAEKVDTDYRLDTCPVMTPARASFVCRAK